MVYFAMHHAGRTLLMLDAQSTHIGCKGLHSQGWWLCCCTAHPHAELNNRLLHRVGFTAEHFSSAKRVSLLHFVLLIRAGCAWVMQILRKRQPAIGPVMCEAFMAGRVSAHRAGWAQVWVMARGGEMHERKWQWQATEAVHGACRERIIVWMWMCIKGLGMTLAGSKRSCCGSCCCCSWCCHLHQLPLLPSLLPRPPPAHPTG